MDEQRSLYKRVNLLGVAVLTETSCLRTKNFQLELLVYMKRVFYIYGELVFKYNRSFGEVIWRAITRLVLYSLSLNAAFFDEQVLHKTWAFVNVVKRRRLERYLNVTPVEKASEPTPASVNTSHYLYSGGLTRHHPRRPPGLHPALLAGARGLPVQPGVHQPGARHAGLRGGAQELCQRLLLGSGVLLPVPVLLPDLRPDARLRPRR